MSSNGLVKKASACADLYSNFVSARLTLSTITSTYSKAHFSPSPAMAVVGLERKVLIYQPSRPHNGDIRNITYMICHGLPHGSLVL
jgi:hypothetical protein